MNQEIARLWGEFKNQPYPEEGHVEQLDFELCDATAAGCISSYLDTGSLEQEKVESLKGCVEYIQTHKSELPTSAQPYFEKLETVVNLVLKDLK